MKIIITGGTGFIGGAVLRQLVAHGHEVTAIVRSGAAAEAAATARATPLIGDLTDIAWLADQLGKADGAVHAATPGDASAAGFDTGVVKAVGHAFGGTGRPYLHTGGIWVYGANPNIVEGSPFDPPALVAWRLPVERSLLDSDVAATVVAPGIVHGHGRGIPALVAGGPRAASGALTMIGDGSQHWVTVHVDDLAELYVLLLERGSGLGTIIGASGENPTVRQLATAAAGPAGVLAASVSDSRTRLGDDFADALLISQQATGERARSLGWSPSRPGLVAEFVSGSYAGG
ncbi:NAD-dependent epimerase/dehydratase family protein [Nakamurella sp.]|uniref:NAD-dependent epimerase/dehydratase family protein n=1 Tax=Nakamurella sp. TaxID=1869182 RepID=UPI0037842244